MDKQEGLVADSNEATNAINITNTNNTFDFSSKQEPKERLKQLINAGRQVEATSPSIDVNQRPAYFDEERFHKAQRTAQKYFINLSLGSTTGLVLLLQIESILVPLLKTGKSRTVPDLYERYVATAKYMRKCYETNFYDPTSEGWKYIKLVRGMHQRIHSLMKEDPNFKQQPPNVWVNQYDMALTQFAFAGLFLLNPQKCGAYNITREELMDVNYYWRLISYYFCIEEQFNLFVYDNDDFDLQVEFLDLVLKHMNDVRVGPRFETGLRMGEGFLLAFEDLGKETTLNILDHWWSPYFSLTGRKELKPYTLAEKWKVIFFKLYFVVLFRSETILSFMTSVYKKRFDKFAANGDEIKPRLALKYKDLICEL